MSWNVTNVAFVFADNELINSRSIPPPSPMTLWLSGQGLEISLPRNSTNGRRAERFIGEKFRLNIVPINSVCSLLVNIRRRELTTESWIACGDD